MAFRLGSSSKSTGKIGRAAKPGETPNRRGIPVTKPTGTPGKGTKPTGK